MPDPHLPRRIACLQPSATVILASVGELDRVVACTKYCADVVPEVRADTQTVATIACHCRLLELEGQRDSLRLARPRDRCRPIPATAVAEILKAGIRFLGLAPRTLDDIYTDIAVISGCVGASERGAKVIAEMQSGNRRRATPDRKPSPKARLLRRMG